MKKAICLLTIIIFSTFLSAQSELFTPIEFKNALKNKTRTITGRPGDYYWQNESKYKLSIKIDLNNKILKGTLTAEYKNNSPDDLGEIVFRLYPNFYKSNSSRGRIINEKFINDGTKISSLNINNIDYFSDDQAVKISGTLMTVSLKNKLRSGQKADVRAEWSFSLPDGPRLRWGAKDESSYFIAYFYPQIAVYDDIRGWDLSQYTGSPEFYNDFSDFEAEIEVPNGFFVWATGTWSNPEELLQDNVYQKYLTATASDEIINIIAPENLGESLLKNGVWKFSCKKVPDFAFAFSSNYLWDGVSVEVEEGRRTFIEAAYSIEATDYSEMADIAKKTVKHYSENFPGVPFPYEKLSVFEGFSGGMEYPMMVNNETFENRNSTVHLATHEIAHTYFPFYMGINETRYAWMDESLANLLSYEIQIALNGEKEPFEKDKKDYFEKAGFEAEVPPMVPSVFLNGWTYSLASYKRPAVALYYLREALGKEKFDESLREFMYRWNGKHPIPLDFFNTFNDFLWQDLNWFWRPWFYEFGYPDLKLNRVEKNGETLKFTIERAGVLPLPIEIYAIEDGKEVVIKKENILIWNGEESIQTSVSYNGSAKIFAINLNNIPDIDLRNNVYEIR